MGGSLVLSSEMGQSTQQRLQPASLTTGVALSMTSIGTGHIKRKSQIRIRKILHAHWGREEEEERGEYMHSRAFLGAEMQGLITLTTACPHPGTGKPTHFQPFPPERQLTRTPCSFLVALYLL